MNKDSIMKIALVIVTLLIITTIVLVGLLHSELG